jgi:integrase
MAKATRRRGHIRQRGSSWVLTYRRGDGTRHWESFPTKEKAELELAKVSPDLIRGEAKAPTRVTFKTAAEAWHENGVTVKGWKPSTTRDYRSVLDKWLVPAFETKRLEDVTARSIEQWRREKMQATGRGKMSRRTADKLVSVLHSIFEYARREYHTRENPVAAVERLPMRYDGGRFDFYTPEEVWALVRAASSVEDEDASEHDRAAREQDGAIVLLAAFSGLRRGECLGLRWRDVDFERQAIRVEHSLSTVGRELGTPKAGVMRSVPMAPDVAQALARLSQRERFTGRSDFVFCGETGEPLDGSALRRRYVEAQKTAKLRALRFHDLRHSFGTIAANAALSGRELQAWLGHADYRTTQRYLHYRERGDEAARLAQAFSTEIVEDVSPHPSGKHAEG